MYVFLWRGLYKGFVFDGGCKSAAANEHQTLPRHHYTPQTHSHTQINALTFNSGHYVDS